MSTSSAIPVTCNCGNSFKVKPAAIGRKVRCPKCKSPCLCKPKSKPESVDFKPDDEKKDATDDVASKPLATTSQQVTATIRAGKSFVTQLLLAILAFGLIVAFLGCLLVAFGRLSPPKRFDGDFAPGATANALEAMIGRFDALLLLLIAAVIFRWIGLSLIHI